VSEIAVTMRPQRRTRGRAALERLPDFVVWAVWGLALVALVVMVGLPLFWLVYQSFLPGRTGALTLHNYAILTQQARRRWGRSLGYRWPGPWRARICLRAG